MREINRQDGITVVVSLHQVDYATKYCPRVVALRSGKLVFDGPSTALTPSLLRDLYGADAGLDFGTAATAADNTSALDPALARAAT